MNPIAGPGAPAAANRGATICGSAPDCTGVRAWRCAAENKKSSLACSTGESMHCAWIRRMTAFFLRLAGHVLLLSSRSDSAGLSGARYSAAGNDSPKSLRTTLVGVIR
jgi:hypothetical protein